MEKISYPLEMETRFRMKYEIKSRIRIDEDIYNNLIDIHKNKYHKKEYFQKTNKIAYLISSPEEGMNIYVYAHDSHLYILSIITSEY